MSRLIMPEKHLMQKAVKLRPKSETEVYSEPENSEKHQFEHTLGDDSEASPTKRKKKKVSRQSVEDRPDTMSSELLAVKDLLVQNSLVKPKTSKLKETGREINVVEVCNTPSEETIYQ